MNNYTQKNNWQSFLFGILFTFIIAYLGIILATLPGLNKIGPLACSILLAVLYRNIVGYPEKLATGISFSATYFLRLAIILFGLKLNINVIFQDGIHLLIKSIFVVIISIVLMMVIGKLMKSNKQITFLIAVGTGICGAAAIAAITPIVKAKHEDSALSIAMIAFVGTIISIMYPLLYNHLDLSSHLYAIWSGLSLHELAHVTLAANPGGEEALATALLAKLSRVFLLIPFSFLLLFWMNRKSNQGSNGKRSVKVKFPYFLIGFILMSVFGSYTLGNTIHLSDKTLHVVDQLTTFLLTSAMVGLGLNIHLKTMKEKALRPLAVLLITSIVLSIITYFIV